MVNRRAQEHHRSWPGLPDVSGKCLACDRGGVYLIDKTRGVEILVKHQALARNGQICDLSRFG